MAESAGDEAASYGAALESRTRIVNGVSLNVVEAGTGPPVVLLHGFPEFWYSWRYQIDAIVGAGFRFIAPDLRGFNRSERPRRVAAYAIDEVAADIVALIEQLSAPVALVGHDWGGVVAWRVARVAPQLVSSLTILNIPHPRALQAHVKNPAQAIRFLYQVAFQPPVIAELALRAGRFVVLRNLLQRGVRRGRVTERDLSLYVEAWSQPGAITGMLNYYRALFRRSPVRSAAAMTPGLAPPTMLIIGEREPVFLRETLEASREYVPNLRFEVVPRARHFVHQDDPERVNALLLDFLRSSK